VHIGEKKRILYQTLVGGEEGLKLGGIGNATIIEELKE
jgi:hypothetical protein